MLSRFSSFALFPFGWCMRADQRCLFHFSLASSTTDPLSQNGDYECSRFFFLVPIFAWFTRASGDSSLLFVNWIISSARWKRNSFSFHYSTTRLNFRSPIAFQRRRNCSSLTFGNRNDSSSRMFERKSLWETHDGSARKSRLQPGWFAMSITSRLLVRWTSRDDSNVSKKWTDRRDDFDKLGASPALMKLERRERTSKRIMR